MRAFFVRLLLFSFLLTACSSSAPAPRSAPRPVTGPAPEAALAPPWGNGEQLGAYLDEYIGALGRNWGPSYAFSGVVAIAKDGEPILFRAYGKADRAAGTVPNMDTRFQIASVSKQFTAVCILQLAEQGKLRLDGTVRTYLPDYPAKTGDVLTIHHLLTHTSGLYDFLGDDTLRTSDPGKPHSTASVLAIFRDKPLAFAPGTKYEYSNSNYFLLGLIVEKVSGESYEHYLQRHVLGPAGMTRTSSVREAPNSAIGYVLDDDEDDELIRPASPLDPTLLFGAGGIHSTARDMLRWDRALAGTSLLSAASHAKRTTPDKDDYAYGVVVETVAGHRVESHNGLVDGFKSQFTRIPDLGLAYVVLSNGYADPSHIDGALLKMLLEGARNPLLEGRPIVPVSPAILERASGEYAMRADDRSALEKRLPKPTFDAIQRISLMSRGTRFVLKPNGQPGAPLCFGGGDTFFTRRAGIEIVLEGKSDEPAASFVLHQRRLTIHYERARARSAASAAKKKDEKGSER